MEYFFENIITDLLTICLIIIGVVYSYTKFYIFNYWARQGIKTVSPSFPFGNFGAVIMQKTSTGELLQKIYNEYAKSERFIGIFGMIRPQLVILDPAIVRAIFIKDFQHFQDRGFYIDEKNDPLSGHLFSLSGDKWKNLRVKLSPVFTSGKLKAMFSTLLNCGDSLVQYIDKSAKYENVVEVRELTARFTTDIIASVAFGIDINSVDNPNTSFRRYGRKALEFSVKNGFRMFTASIFPKLQKLIKLKAVDQDVEDFMIALVKQTLEHREKNNVSRKDLLQLLIQLRNTGKVQDDDIWSSDIVKDEKNKKLTLNEMAAQAWVFFIAGFETSSTTMAYCLYELAKNTEIQQQVQREIDEVTRMHNNEITYESVQEMKYLESVIDETLRKYPIVPVLNRECTKDYVIPNTNIKLKKGTSVLIPVLGLQRDPKFYPEPEKFIPERFSQENAKNFEEKPYMPFGDGPRICIGVRLGKMQTKVGLILMLRNCSYTLPESALRFDEPKATAKAFLLAPEGGVNLKVTKRF